MILSCIQGRQKTFKKCCLKNDLERLVVYTLDEDLKLLEELKIAHKIYSDNKPLAQKWNNGVKALKNLNFKYVIMMGADNYFCDNFIDFVESHIDRYDMIGFTDLYFEQGNKNYYWSGYSNHRKGEPAGCGKVYTKSALEKVNYQLFNGAGDKGLDGLSWRRTKHLNRKTFSLKDNGLYLFDVKDGEGITKLESIKNVNEVSINLHNI